MKFHHVGIPVFEQMEGMQYADGMKVWFSDPSATPYNVEFVCFDPDSPMAAAVQDGTHVAYVVDDIEKAVEGKSILWPITQVAPDFKLAFIYDNGLAIELIQMG
jgi:hypothetical protein